MRAAMKVRSRPRRVENGCALMESGKLGRYELRARASASEREQACPSRENDRSGYRKHVRCLSEGNKPSRGQCNERSEKQALRGDRKREDVEMQVGDQVRRRLWDLMCSRLTCTGKLEGTCGDFIGERERWGTGILSAMGRLVV